MKKIHFDNGVQRFSLNGGVLKFNPCDPNIYARFLEMGEKLESLEAELAKKAAAGPEGDNGQNILMLMAQADRQAKELLNWVFGGGNDFDKLLEGVNLMAVAENGRQVIENLLEVLEPILLDGAKKYTDDAVRTAREKAKQRRGGLQ